jgi:predicted RNA-binding Zn ribbon-like protein
MDLKLLGGALALDFVNTRDPLLAPDAREYLDSPRALTEWGKHVGVLPPRARQRLSETDLGRAHEIRAVLERLFTVPTKADGRSFALAYAQAVAGAGLVEAGDRFRLGAANGVEAILLPVLDSARELLTGPELARVRRCGAPDCGWLFVDRSRNGTRRWCRMDGCGAREKMRRYRARANPGK